jgi:hypothetical protein
MANIAAKNSLIKTVTQAKEESREIGDRSLA